MPKKVKAPKSKNGAPRGAGAKKSVVLRDSIAIEAMQALLASRAFAPVGDVGAATMLARAAYSVADAMLAEREAAAPPE